MLNQVTTIPDPRRRFTVARDPWSGRPLLFGGALVLVAEQCAACGRVIDVYLTEPEALAARPPLCPACLTGGHPGPLPRSSLKD